MRLVILGNDTFAKPLRELGHEVLYCGPGGDLALADPDPDWVMVSKLLNKRGFEPEAVLVTDNVGSRCLPTGLPGAQAVTAFYGVDAPLNRFWQMPYAKLFDLAFLDQRTEARDLAASHPGAVWLPVAVDPALYEVEASGPEEAGVCFVGVVDERVRPKRSALLAKVAKLSRLTVRGGRQEAWFPTQEAARLYASHQVTLNENLFPGVTTRPLEAMAAGGCLLSEAAPGDMDLLFQEYQQLVYFGPQDLEDKLEQLLKDKTLRDRLRRQGRELVRAEHGFQRRAADIIRHIEVMQAKPFSSRPRARGGEALRLEGEALFMAGLRWPAKGGGRRVLRGATRLRAAAADGADPLPAARAAGLAELCLGRPQQALPHLRRAAEMGSGRERLAWVLAAEQAGSRGELRQARQGLGLPGRPGEALFHLAAARLLAREGCEVSIGFNRQGLHPVLWSAVEHLLEATKREPGLAEAWELLGDLLLAKGAPNQAFQAYERARELAEGSELQAKQHQAARKGYIL